MKMTKQEFLSKVDHSLLKPQLTREEIMEGLQFAKENHCASVCINPCNLDMAREVLEGTDVKIGTVIGFPSGAHTTFSKVAEAGAAYVKTSTGFAPSGATVEDIKLMKDTVSEKVHVKAAGGINNFAECVAMIEAGSDRIGISKTKAILEEF